jgi:hypothetical protein
MGRLVCDVGKERFAVTTIRLDVVNHFVRVGFGGVIVVRQTRQVASVFGEDQARRISRYVRHAPVISTAIEQAEIALETAGCGDLVWRLAKMPLARHIRVVSRLFQQLRQCHHIVIEVTFVSWNALLIGCGPFAHIAEAVQMGVDAREQHRTRRRATCVCVEICETNAVCGQRVNVRRLYFSAKRTNIGVAHIIGHDQYDIRSAICRLLC